MSIRAVYLIKNSLFSVLQVIVASVSFAFIYYEIVSNLGKTQLGVWSVITAIPMAAAVFGSGVSGCILRYIPIYVSKDDSKAFNEILWSGVVFNFLLGIIALGFGYAFSVPILHFLFGVKSLPVFYVIFFRVALTTFLINFVSSVLLNALDGLLLTHVKNQILIVGSLVISVVVFFFLKPFGLISLFYAQLLQSIITILLTIYKLTSCRIFNIKFFCINSKYLKIFLTFGQGFHLISFSVLLFEPVTKFFLARYFNLETVGIYEFVNKFILQIRTLIVNTVQIIIPVVTKDNAEGNSNYLNVYYVSQRAAMLISSSLFSTAICYGLTLIKFYDSGHIKVYFYMIVPLSIAYLLNILASTAYSMFLGLGKLKPIIISHLLSTSLNFIIFKVASNFLSDAFMILPVATSVAISSVYLSWQFKKQMKIISIATFADLKTYTICFITILAISILTLLNLNGFVLVFIAVLHTILLLYSLLINNFITRIFKKFSLMF